MLGSPTGSRIFHPRQYLVVSKKPQHSKKCLRKGHHQLVFWGALFFRPIPQFSIVPSFFLPRKHIAKGCIALDKGYQSNQISSKWMRWAGLDWLEYVRDCNLKQHDGNPRCICGSELQYFWDKSRSSIHLHSFPPGHFFIRDPLTVSSFQMLQR